MSDPLIIEITVDTTPEHAFETWTIRCATWWPRDHTMSGDATAITFEPFAGGRIFERGSDGSEHDWGRVTEWNPPHRLTYEWHMFFDASEATDIEVTFRASDRGTVVRLEQRGWDRLGDAGPSRRARTGEVWTGMVARFSLACVSTREG